MGEYGEDILGVKQVECENNVILLGEGGREVGHQKIYLNNLKTIRRLTFF